MEDECSRYSAKSCSHQKTKKLVLISSSFPLHFLPICDSLTCYHTLLSSRSPSKLARNDRGWSGEESLHLISLRPLHVLKWFVHRCKKKKVNQISELLQENKSIMCIGRKIMCVISKITLFHMHGETWGLFLERPGKLSCPKSNSWNYDPLSMKSCSFDIFQM